MLGDENNSQQIDLATVALDSCALLVIDELGDPRAVPSRPFCFSRPSTPRASPALPAPPAFRHLRERRPHSRSRQGARAVGGEHGIAGSPEARTSRSSSSRRAIT